MKIEYLSGKNFNLLDMLQIMIEGRIYTECENADSPELFSQHRMKTVLRIQGEDC